MAAQNEPVLFQALPCLEQQAPTYYPRPVKGRRKTQQSSLLSQSVALQHCRNASFGSSSEVELLEIMLKPSDGPIASYLGVSPPVRSGCCGGAANPWSHDRSWKMSAYSASSTNLQALRELDNEGESFLKAKDSAARLVLSATDAPVVDPAECSSDAGSETTAVNECTPFTCRTAYFLG